MSRCAPASDAPITVRSSSHSFPRTCHSAVSPPTAGGMNAVRNPSEIAKSSIVSNGVLFSSAAMSPIVRPSRCLFSGLNVACTVRFAQSARPRSGPAARAFSSSSRRFLRSFRYAMRSSIDIRKRPSQPLSASNTKPANRLIRSVIGCGIVSARTSPPLLRAKSDADSWFSIVSGSPALSAFQFSGRCAAVDRSDISCLISCEKRPTAGRNSSDVPS